MATYGVGPPACWPGAIEQWAELNRIADAQCKADPDHGCGEHSVSNDRMGRLTTYRTCATHSLLRGDGRVSATFFRELLLMRYLAPRLEAEEFDEAIWPGVLTLGEIARARPPGP